MGDLLSISEVAKKWGISHKRVQVLCTQNRIDGARKAGNMWVIPADAQKPKDPRIKKK